MNWIPDCPDCKIKMETKRLSEGCVIYKCPKCGIEIDQLDDDLETN